MFFLNINFTSVVLKIKICIPLRLLYFSQKSSSVFLMHRECYHLVAIGVIMIYEQCGSFEKREHEVMCKVHEATDMNYKRNLLTTLKDQCLIDKFSALFSLSSEANNSSIRYCWPNFVGRRFGKQTCTAPCCLGYFAFLCFYFVLLKIWNITNACFCLHLVRYAFYILCTFDPYSNITILWPM